MVGFRQAESSTKNLGVYLECGHTWPEGTDARDLWGALETVPLAVGGPSAGKRDVGGRHVGGQPDAVGTDLELVTRPVHLT
ncbi:hypothetical protein GCM10009525_00300 [Streptosporangium amethystogenes subsp. fukuiense]